jgi:hypothetical protein
MIRFTKPLKPSKLMSPACPEPPWHVIIPVRAAGRYSITLGDGKASGNARRAG